MSLLKKIAIYAGLSYSTNFNRNSLFVYEQRVRYMIGRAKLRYLAFCTSKYDQSGLPRIIAFGSSSGQQMTLGFFLLSSMWPEN